MKKVLAIIILFVLASVAVEAQDHSRTDAVVKKFQQFYNAKQPDSLYGIMSARIKQLLPLDKVKEMVTGLHQKVGVFTGYEFTKQDTKGIYYRSYFKGMSLILIASIDSAGNLDVFRFVPDKEEGSLGAERGASDISAVNGNVVLRGTLTMPEGIKKVPVVLIIAGSGPTDRDGNNNMGLLTNIYRILADSLRDAGIACVRYDKRGIGASAAGASSEIDSRFDDMVADAEAFIKALNADSRFSGVYVVGHSEGSLVGMLAAENGGVKKYVSLAGIGEPADKVLRVQVSGMGADVEKNVVIIMDSLKKGYDVKNIDPQLLQLFRPSIQPYMRSWLKYDPAKEIAKLKIPVMIVQGHKDLQVGIVQADILKKGVPAAQLITYSSMNHLLRDVNNDEENKAAYHNGSMPLTAGFTDALIAFIKK